MQNQTVEQTLPNELWRMVFSKFIDFKNPKLAWRGLHLLEQQGFKTIVQQCGIKEQFAKKYTPEWVDVSWKLILECHKNMPEEYTEKVFRNLIDCSIDSHDVINFTTKGNINVSEFENQPLGESMLIGPINATMTNTQDWIIVLGKLYPVLIFAWVARMKYDGEYGPPKGSTLTVTRFIGLHLDDKGYNWVTLHPKQLNARKRQAIIGKPFMMQKPISGFYGFKTELINSDHERTRYLDYNIHSDAFFANSNSLKSVLLSLAGAIDTYILDFCYIPDQQMMIPAIAMTSQ